MGYRIRYSVIRMLMYTAKAHHKSTIRFNFVKLI